MAILFKDLKDKLVNSPLTDGESGWVQQTEKYIDGRLTTEFDGKTIYIKTQIIEFHEEPSGSHINSKSTRKKLMQAELIKRYNDAGWSINEESDGYYSLGEKK